MLYLGLKNCTSVVASPGEEEKEKSLPYQIKLIVNQSFLLGIYDTYLDLYKPCMGFKILLQGALLSWPTLPTPTMLTIRNVLAQFRIVPLGKFHKDIVMPYAINDNNSPNISQARPTETFWALLSRRAYGKGWEAQNEQDEEFSRKQERLTL